MFQQKMAESGITSAMMKMGEMYEKGEGIEKSNANALKMYQQAQAAGYAKATDSIERLKNLINKPNKTTKVNKSKAKPNQNTEAIHQRQAQAAARTKALKIAKAKAQREKIQKQKRAKARQLKSTKAKAARDAKLRAARAKAARDAKLRAAKTKAYRKEKALRAAKRAKANKRLTRAVNNVIPTTDYEEDEEETVSIETNVTPEKGFKSDPCKSKAARLLSICR